jgi:hypothetical protein
VPESAFVDLDEMRDLACRDKAQDTALRQGSGPPFRWQCAARATNIMRVTVMARVGLLPEAVHRINERVFVPQRRSVWLKRSCPGISEGRALTPKR